jgi:outer membrane protein assembly factor BamB
VPTAGVPMPVPANSFVRQWANDLKLVKDPVEHLYLSDDTVFVYTASHLVYAIGRSGGDLKYLAQPEVSGGILKPPVIMGDRVVYPSGSTVEVFNNRGRPIRTIELEKPVRSGGIGAGNTLYIGLDHPGGRGVMASIDITKAYHVINWELMTFGAIDATPARFENVIYAGSEDGRLYAVTEERGAVWALENRAGFFATSGKFVSDIYADDTGVYASNTDSKLYCLDRLNGHIKWQYYAAVPLKTAPVVTSTMVYQYLDGGGIAAIDKAAGQFNRAPRWIIKNAVQFLSEDQTYAYLRRRDNRLLAINKATGELAFISKKTPFEIFATNTKDAIIYGSTPNGIVWAVRPVLKEGEVGNLVMDFRAEPLAVAAVAAAR